MRDELKDSPLMFSDFVMNEKEGDVYLGDVIHSDGLAASVEATISRRIAKVKGMMYEAVAILADILMQAVGGMTGAWDMWELQMILKLLANCGSWMGSQQQHYDTLDNLQNLYCCLVYSFPDSTHPCLHFVPKRRCSAASTVSGRRRWFWCPR